MRSIVVAWVVASVGCGGSSRETARSADATRAHVPASEHAAASRAPLVAEAKAAYLQKNYARCAELYERAESTDPRRAADDAYNAACCRALSGSADASIRMLQRSVERGYRDADHLKRDSDLEGVREHPQFGRVLEGARSNLATYLKSINAELYEIYREDQSDRQGDVNKIDGTSVVARDAKRRERVRQIVNGGEAKASADYFHAAMVFQHGDDARDFQMAHELALTALKLDPDDNRSKWLAAASKDRELMTVGKPQLYGTQFRKPSPNADWELYEVDPSVTDEERAKWNVPPLAEAKKRVDEMNARK